MSREAVESARRALVGEVHTGFQTLATAFGADFATDFEGVSVERVAEEGPRPPTQPLLRVVRRSLLHGRETEGRGQWMNGNRQHP